MRNQYTTSTSNGRTQSPATSKRRFVQLLLASCLIGGANHFSVASAQEGPATQLSAEPKPDTPWPTKESLLAAVRSGEFRGLPDIRANQAVQTAPLTSSVIAILQTEYGVPSLATGKTAGSMTCKSEAAEEIRRLLTSITAAQLSSLSDKPPAFFKDAPTQSYEQDIRMSLKSLGMGGGLCSVTVMGVARPHPYGAALKQFAGEFNHATKEYVETARATRKADYEAEQKAIAEAAAKRKAEADAAAQARIDAERARIQKQQQQQQGRVSG